MAHPDWEDLSAFFDADEFATLAVITRGSETVAEVLGIFDDPNAPASVGELVQDLPSPQFTAPEVELSGVKPKDIATIEGVAFDVMEAPQRDGTGISVLILAKPNVIYNAGL
jgi:hypothetical protein